MYLQDTSKIIYDKKGILIFESEGFIRILQGRHLIIMTKEELKDIIGTVVNRD